GALAVVGTVEGAREQLLPHVFAVLLELLGRKRLGAANGIAGDAAPRAALALPVLHRLHLHVLPVLAEAADDATVAVAVAVAVAPAFPNADRRKIRRLRRGRAPLVARVIGDAVHTHLSAAPGLYRRPLDAQVDVARLARVVVAQIARRAPGAARIDPDANVAVGHPLFGIDHFPVGVLVAAARDRVRIVARHDFPCGLVALLEREPLPIRPIGKNHGIAPFCRGAEHVGAED